MAQPSNFVDIKLEVIMEELKKILEQKKIELGMSERVFSQHLGMSPGNWNFIKNGKIQFTLNSLLKIEKVYPELHALIAECKKPLLDKKPHCEECGKIFSQGYNRLCRNCFIAKRRAAIKVILCIDCGKPISEGAKERCLNCFHKAQSSILNQKYNYHRVCKLCNQNLPVKYFDKAGERSYKDYCRECECKKKLVRDITSILLTSIKQNQRKEKESRKLFRATNKTCPNCKKVVLKGEMVSKTRCVFCIKKPADPNSPKRKEFPTYKEYQSARFKYYYNKGLKDKVAANTHKYRASLKSDGGKFTAAEWRNLKKYYENICLCCGISEEETPEKALSPDHVVPVSKGGSGDIDNIQPLCFKCNLKKKDKIIDYRPGREEFAS